MKNLLSVLITMTTMSCIAKTKPPAEVQAAFTKNFPGITVQKWDKEGVAYEANFTSDGKEMSATFDAKGIWLETETDIAITELPENILSYVKEHYKGISIKEAAILKTPDGDMYEAEVKGKDLLFDMHEKFLKEMED